VLGRLEQYVHELASCGLPPASLVLSHRTFYGFFYRPEVISADLSEPKRLDHAGRSSAVPPGLDLHNRGLQVRVLSPLLGERPANAGLPVLRSGSRPAPRQLLLPRSLPERDSMADGLPVTEEAAQARIASLRSAQGALDLPRFPL
jgi:hypothetical protein